MFADRESGKKCLRNFRKVIRYLGINLKAEVVKAFQIVCVEQLGRF
jgi:hypothetical protein